MHYHISHLKFYIVLFISTISTADGCTRQQKLKKDKLPYNQKLEKDFKTGSVSSISDHHTMHDVLNFAKSNILDANIKYNIFFLTSRKLSFMHMHNSFPLDETQKKEYISILKYIYKQGVDINKKRSSGNVADNGNTELMTQISFGRDLASQEITLMLLRDFKADPFILDAYGKKNALHFLLLKGHVVQQCIIDAVLMHVDTKKHINDQTKYGDTALHIACARKNIKQIKQLLQQGANLDISNNNKQKPMDMLSMNEAEVRKFLSKYLIPIGLNGKFLNGIHENFLEEVATIDRHLLNRDPNWLNELKKEITIFLEKLEKERITTAHN